jgi:hypothetical protein
VFERDRYRLSRPDVLEVEIARMDTDGIDATNVEALAAV